MRNRDPFVLSDEEVILFRNGDETVFWKVYDTFKMRIYVSVYRTVRLARKTEDITCDTFVSVWNNRLLVTSYEQLIDMLFIAARSQTVKWLRKKPANEPTLTIIETLKQNNITLDKIYSLMIEDIFYKLQDMSPDEREDLMNRMASNKS